MGRYTKSKLVFGVGVNDADYAVQVNGVVDKQYSVWRDMLYRCYRSKGNASGKNRTYSESTVCNEWLLFSSFKKWMDCQNWLGNEIDKDLIVRGNKHYSPMTCVFVSHLVNCFITDLKTTKSKLTGAFLNKATGKYQASCKNPFSGKLEHLGLYSSEIEAHQAWKIRKHELACQLADSQADKRVAEALRSRYK